jgi:cyclopropane-fatty-acyl-phospholipid synthase
MSIDASTLSNLRDATHWADRAKSLPASARTVLRLLQHLQHGRLDVQFPDGSMHAFGKTSDAQPHAVISLANWNVCAAALKSGDIGFAESYIAGEWHTPDLSALLKLFVANRDAIEQAVYGSWWGSLLYRVKHWLNRNTRGGSRKNIHAHYDLGNAFYRLWLDETMTYSSAWFAGDKTQSLAQAQRAKMRRALAATGVQPGQRMLEIGCGWGATALTAAQEFGAQVTGVTLSTEQLAEARTRMDAAGCTQQIELRLQDYRDIADPAFDAIVSIEMFEAVGREYWPGFFATVRDKLKPGARACIQSITIRDDLFERYVRGTDFIQQYIFPGGLLPSPSEFKAAAERAGLRVVESMSFGPDYGETLARWRHDFLAQQAHVLEIGFDQRFMRIWEFYLAYCEAAFATGNTDVIQFTLEKA